MTIKQHPKFTNFYEVQHPLIMHKLSMLRDVATNNKDFKALVAEISALLVYETTKKLPLRLKTIKTPLATCKSPVLAEKKPVVLAVLRAGLGMVDGFFNSFAFCEDGTYRNLSR